MYGHPEMQDEMEEIFGETICAYTRKQAIEDGVLVDIMQDEQMSDIAKRHYKFPISCTYIAKRHYKFPISCTSSVFGIMKKAVENSEYSNDYAGILHDMLWMSKVMKRQIDESTIIFRVIIAGAGRQRNYDFKLQVGPGDQGEPVITIMMPDED